MIKDLTKNEQWVLYYINDKVDVTIPATSLNKSTLQSLEKRGLVSVYIHLAITYDKKAPKGRRLYYRYTLTDAGKAWVELAS